MQRKVGLDCPLVVMVKTPTQTWPLKFLLAEYDKNKNDPIKTLEARKKWRV